jgi:hypothetical protein
VGRKCSIGIYSRKVSRIHKPEFVKDYREWLSYHHTGLHVLKRNKRNTVYETKSSLCDCRHNIWFTRPLYEIIYSSIPTSARAVSKPYFKVTKIKNTTNARLCHGTILQNNVQTARATEKCGHKFSIIRRKEV